MEKTQQNKTIFYILFSTIVAICFAKIFFCSVTIDGNFHYHCIICDYWNFTKSILNGSTLYVDIIDHKGLYLYLLYIPFVLISKNNMWGVVLAETIIFCGIITTFYFIMKSKYNKLRSLVYTNIFSLCFLVANLTIPALFNTDIFIIPFYYLTYLYVLSKEKYTNKSFFLIGIMLGFFINIKYSSILYFASLFLFATFLHFYKKHSIKQYVLLLANGLLGVVLINVPFLIYLLKTNTLKAYIYYSQLASNISNYIFIFVILFIVCLCFSIALYIRKNKYFEILLCLSTLCLSLVGMFFNGNYIITMILIIAPCVFISNIKPVLFYIALNILFTISLGIPNDNVDMKTIAQEYGINNSNVLYIAEDLGFGVYGEEDFIEPYQWIPVRFLYNKNAYNEILNLNKNRIINKEFEFVVTGYEDKDDKTNKNKEFENQLEQIVMELTPYLEENYNSVEIKTINNDKSNIILWIKK